MMYIGGQCTLVEVHVFVTSKRGGCTYVSKEQLSKEPYLKAG